MSSASQTMLVVALLAAAITAAAHAQAIGTPRDGPVIHGYGPVYDVPTLDVIPATDVDYRVVFDVAAGADQPDQVNSRIETLARFLNMHARAGVPVGKMHLTLVLHGSAGKDALDDAAYQERFGVANPNRPLIDALVRAGVDVYLCGQTAMHRGLPKGQLNTQVKLALSAMTMLVTLQSDGYSLIAF